MRLQEAYNELGVSSNASEDEVKKAYRNLAKKYHPDVNKDPGSEAKFKTINEAYNLIQKGEEQQTFAGPSYSNNVPFDINEILSNFAGFGGMNNSTQQNKRHPVVQIHITANLTFAEAVLGKEHPIKYSRSVKCNPCNGNGQIPENICKECNSTGRVTKQHGNQIISSMCMKCANVKHRYKSCTDCNGVGTKSAETSLTVNIPAGVQNGNVLKMNMMGNYVGVHAWGQDQYSDALLNITVNNTTTLTTKNKDVVCNIELSLKDAVLGCEKEVETVLGAKSINIPPMSKNKEEIVLPNLGIGKVGNQVVILNVSYPENITELVKEV